MLFNKALILTLMHYGLRCIKEIFGVSKSIWNQVLMPMLRYR